MKPTKQGFGDGVRRWRLTPRAMILTAISVAVAGFGLPPEWWQNGVVLDANQTTDDFAAVNVGQLKNTAVMAIDHVQNSLYDGAGDELIELVAQFRAPSPERDDFAAVNVGQLKNVAAPIYRRLIQARYATGFPWNDSAPERDDFAAVNVGQLKQMFSFDLNRDSDGDHMPDLWESANGLNPQSPADATDDPDRDGISNLQEFSNGTDPQSLTISPDTRPWAAIDWTHLDGVTFDFDPCGGSLLTRFRTDASPLSVAGTDYALLRGDGGVRFKLAADGVSFILGFSQPPLNSVSFAPVYGFDVSPTGVACFHPGGSVQLSSTLFLNAVTVQTSDVFCIERVRGQLVYSINGVPLLTIPAPSGKLGIVAQLNSVGLTAGCCEAWGHRRDADNDWMDDLWVGEQLSSHPEVTPSSFTPVSDADGDGLTNLEEFLNYLDPFNSDSNGDLVPDSFAVNTADLDKDGLPAGVEAFYGLSDSNPDDAWTDLDGDGLPNLREYQDRTNLNTPASQIVDTDGDGMSDIFELRYWPLVSGNSYSPASDFFNSVADSDADGVLNFEEAALALDPLNRQTRPGAASDAAMLADHLPGPGTSGGSLPARQGYLDWDNDGLPDWKEHWANRYAVTQPTAPVVPPPPGAYFPTLPPYRSDPRAAQSAASTADSDSDGVSDYLEIQNGSNPFNPDTNSNGTSDFFDGGTYFPPGDPAQCVMMDTTYRQVERRFFSGLDVMIGGINTETNFGWFGYQAPSGSDPGGWRMSYPYWDLGSGGRSSRSMSAAGAGVADMIALTEQSMATASLNCRVVSQHPWQTSAYCGAGTFTPSATYPTPTPPVSITSWAYGRSHMVLHFTTPEAAEARAGMTVQAIYTASDLDMFHDPNATATVTQHLHVPVGPDLRSAHYLRSPTPINLDASANSSGSTPEAPEILVRSSSLWIAPTQPVPGLLTMNNATDEGWLLSNGDPINNRDWPAGGNPGTGDWRSNNLNKEGGGISTTGLVEVPFLGIIPGSAIPRPWLISEEVTPGHPLYDPQKSGRQLHELAPTITVNQTGTGRIRLYAIRDQGMVSEAVWEIPIPVGLATTVDLFPMLYSGRPVTDTVPSVDTIPYGPNVRYWVEAITPGSCQLHYGIKRVKTDGTGFEHHWEENTFVSLLPVEVVIDHNRDGKLESSTDARPKELVDQAAYDTAGQFRQKGAIVWANLDYDEENVSSGKPVADTIRFWHNGQSFEASDEDYTIRNGERSIAPYLEGYEAPPPEQVHSKCPDVAAIKVMGINKLPAGHRVLLRVARAEDVRAFHFYKRIPDFAQNDPDEEAIWGGFSPNGAPWQNSDHIIDSRTIDITKWVNENATNYVGFQETRRAEGDPFVFGIEAMLYKGVKYGTSSGEFDGYLDFTVIVKNDEGQEQELDKFRFTCMRLPAFPGAQGFGMWSQGGRGGEVYKVTNLNDSGPGSLREGIVSRQSLGAAFPGTERRKPRTIVFEVGGRIALGQQDKLNINRGLLTIAGQTASGQGITLTDATFRVSGSEGATGKAINKPNDVIIRYLRTRRATSVPSGKDPNSSSDYPMGPDAFEIKSASRVIVDHCSFSGGIDGSLDIVQANQAANEQPEMDVTAQWCFVHHTLDPHSKASLIRGKFGARYSILGCFYGHNETRNPEVGWLANATGDSQRMILEFSDNVVYNWKDRFCGLTQSASSGLRLQFLANYYKPGNDTGDPVTAFQIQSTGDTLYFANNRIRGSAWSSAYEFVGDHGAAAKAVSPFMTNFTSTGNALTSRDRVRAHGGCSRSRDTADLAYVNEVPPGTENPKYAVTGTIPSALISSYPSSGVQPVYSDSDNDGLADGWEAGYAGSGGIDKFLPWKDDDGDGWTNLEEYLNKTNPKFGNDPMKNMESNVDGPLF